MDKNYGYKHTKGFVIFFVFMIIGLVSVAYGQVVNTGSPNTPSGYSIDVTTGNLISNGSLTSSTGWNISGAAGSPTPDGYIFSYSSGTIDQTITAANIPINYQNTSAVFVTGISYGFQYRFQCANAIGFTCETGGVQDTLNSTFTYYNKDGSIGHTAYYGLGSKNTADGNPAYNPNWQSLAETYTFAGAKTLTTFGSAKLSITGLDGGFWGCNPDCYGPQVKNAYMTVNYSVDPCILNPAFNPSCSGFQNVLQGSKSPTFYYSYNIAQSLPHIGGGVILHGYDYGFNWWNYGSCYNTFLFWCTDYRTDGGGTVNFRVTDKNNTIMFADSWYREGNNAGGSYSSRYLFPESRNTLDMGRVDWWVTNSWNNFAVVGWTRPIWTPDPCYTNGLYSPNCSNFQDTLNQVMADIKAQQEKISAQNASVSSTTTTPSSTITTTIADATTTNPSVTVTTDSNTIAGTSESESDKKDSKSNLSLALSLIRSNERREQTLAITTAQQAVSAAVNTANQSQREAETIAAAAKDASSQSAFGSNDSAAQSMQADRNDNRSRDSSGSIQLSGGPSTNVQTLLPPSPPPSAAQLQQNSQISMQDTGQSQTTVTESTLPVPYSPVIVAAPMPMTVPQSQPIIQQQQQAQNALPDIPQPQVTMFTNQVPMPQAIPTPQLSPQVEQPQIPTQLALAAPSVDIRSPESETATSPTNFITNRTNPITEIVENRPTQNQSNRQTESKDSVNKTVQPNELAGNVDISSIAVAPQGFNVYASLVLRDAAFYAPKEIYRGQRNVDNVRVLRNLASDRLHQEMIDQQYRR